jgi:hypothetical protein
MRLSHGKVVRCLYLILFTASSIVSFIKYHTHAPTIALLCLIGYIAFDIICFLKDKSKPVPSINPELQKIIERQNELEVKFNTVANDAGLAKLASSFRR